MKKILMLVDYTTSDLWKRVGNALTKHPNDMTLDDIVIKSTAISCIVLAIMFTILLAYRIGSAIVKSKKDKKDK